MLQNNKTTELITSFIKNPRSSVLLYGSVKGMLENAIEQIAEGVMGSSYKNRIIPVFPEKSSISISQIRELKKQFTTKISSSSSTSVDRMAVLYCYDRVQEDVQNALLKLLEEPIEGTLLCIVTKESNTLLPTITSRTQKIPVLPIEEGDAKKFLSKYFNDSKVIDKLYLLSAGDAEKLQKFSDNLEYDDEQIQQAKNFLRKSQFDRLMDVKLYENKDELYILIESLMIVAEVGLHHNISQISKWKNILVSCKKSTHDLSELVSPKLVYTFLCLSV